MALTQERAELRSKAIEKGSILYNFHVSLQKGDLYSGYAEILFRLSEVPQELVVDFKGKEVTRLFQNGEDANVKLEGGFLYLETSKLKVG